MRVSNGFTLLELMIAIIIFSLISTASYKLFNSVVKSKQATDKIFVAMDARQKAEIIIEKDIMQIIGRPIQNEYGNQELAVFTPTLSAYLIEFTRTGWNNPLDNIRSDLQRVAYAFENNSFVRYYWPVLDRAPNPVQIRQVLLSNIDSINVLFIDTNHMQHTSWPPPAIIQQPQRDLGPKSNPEKTPPEIQVDNSSMLAGIKVFIQHNVYGPLTLAIPTGLAKSDKKNRKKLIKADKKQKDSQQKYPEKNGFFNEMNKDESS